MRQSNGLVLGTFMPLHDAHLFVFDVAQQLVENITVLLCSTPDDPIPGEIRYRWLQEMLPDTIKLRHFHGDLPWVSRNEDLIDAWADVVREHHDGRIDLLIGSDWPMAKLAESIGARPFLADPHRVAFPVETAEIMAAPHNYWRMLAPPVRSHYQKRICLLGPESVGKSRMAHRLAERYDTRVIPEYGRTYDELFKQKGPWDMDELVELAVGHVAIQKAVARHAGAVVFEDTDPIQTVAWAEYLLEGNGESLLSKLEGWQPADHYLLLSSDVAWVDDGIRYDPKPKVRQWFFDRTKELLDRRGLSYSLITGSDWDDRNEQGLAAVEEVMKRPER